MEKRILNSVKTAIGGLGIVFICQRSVTKSNPGSKQSSSENCSAQTFHPDEDRNFFVQDIPLEKSIQNLRKSGFHSSPIDGLLGTPTLETHQNNSPQDLSHKINIQSTPKTRSQCYDINRLSGTPNPDTLKTNSTQDLLPKVKTNNTAFMKILPNSPFSRVHLSSDSEKINPQKPKEIPLRLRFIKRTQV